MKKSIEDKVPAKKNQKTVAIQKVDSTRLDYAHSHIVAQVTVIAAFVGVVIWLLATQGIIGAILAFFALLLAVLYLCRPKS
ncbi:MAG: hypothetical protein JNM09_15130 [Blastocatellia bacterium]|nr:hypothetical protein [Blastocatellia bacterium]